MTEDFILECLPEQLLQRMQMDDYFLRPAEEKDIERMLGIISNHGPDEEKSAQSFLEEYFSSKPERKNGFHYVLESGNEVVAVGGYMRDPQQGEYWVGLLYVDPYYRGQGLGNKLLEKVIEDVKELGSKRILVSLDEEDIKDPAIRFYTGKEFENTGLKLNPPLKSLQKQHTLVRSIVENEVE